MNSRVGQFFLMVGLVVMFIFVASYQLGDPNFSFFFLGLGALILGAFLIFKHRKRGGEAERFRWIRKMLSRKKKE